MESNQIENKAAGVSNLAKTRNDIKAAEKKVAEGVQAVFDTLDLQNKYDAQGIATLNLDPNEDKELFNFLKGKFVNGGENGISVLVFKKDFIQHPPLRFMVDQKIASFIRAFENIYGKKLDKKGIEDAISGSLQLQQLKDSLTKTINDNNDLTIKEQEKITKQVALKQKEIEKINKSNLSNDEKQQLLTKKNLSEYDDENAVNKAKGKARKEKIAKVFHTEAKKIMDETISETLEQLYKVLIPYEAEPAKNKESKKNAPDSFRTFCKKIIKESELHTADDRSILTFDIEQQKFSYDEKISFTPAHNRTLGQPTANFSYVFDGNFTPKNQEGLKLEGKEEQKSATAEVTSAIIKHASLAPLDAIYAMRIDDPNEENIDILIDTCDHIEEVAEAMARLRQHGQSGKQEGVAKNIDVDWTYQLLTTNFFNSDKQASSYGYIVKAANLMTGATIGKANKVDLTMHVFNAGINDWASWNLDHSEMQRNENTKAYVHITRSLNEHIDSLMKKDDNLKLVSQYDTSRRRLNINDKYTALDDKYEVQAVNSQSFNTLRNHYKDLQNAFRRNQQSRLDYLNNEGFIQFYHGTPNFGKIEKYDNKILQTEIEDNKIKYNPENKEYVLDKRVMINAEKKEIIVAVDTTIHPPDIGLKNHFFMEAQFSLQKQMIECKIKMNALIKKSQKLNDEIYQQSKEIEDAQKKEWKEHKKIIENSIKELPIADLTAKLNDKDQSVRDRAADEILSVAALVYKSYMDELYYTGDYREPKNAALFNAYLSSYQHITGLMASTGCKSANDRTYVARLFLAALEGRDRKVAPLPPAAHKDEAAFKKLNRDMSKVAMSNSADAVPINDTGGTAKVSIKKFKYLLDKVFNYLNKFGDKAAHKMNNWRVLNKLNDKHKKKKERKVLRTNGMFRAEKKEIPEQKPQQRVSFRKASE